MTEKKGKNKKRSAGTFLLGSTLAILGCAACLALVYLIGFSDVFATKYVGLNDAHASSTPKTISVPVQTLDKNAYDLKLLSIAHVATSSPWYSYFLTGTTTGTTTVKKQLWPVKTVYPNYGALLPANRIVAYYGNFYSKGMGVLGQYPPDVMIPRLLEAAAEWKAADPSTPVIPAIDYIAVTAQGSPGADGMYRLRMPDSQIDEAVALAKQVNGIVILDVQVGDSKVSTEVPLLQKYLEMPNVHLALDPEFDMSPGVKPGTVIGTMSYIEINWAANYLANLVRTYNLPPKILVVHRFTEEMVTGASKITPLPEVQVVMDMDGWGFAAKKINTYNSVIQPEPVQFTGFKLFYKNDILPPSTAMMTPSAVLKLTPAPSFIQYQ
jgi:hypothetical protein